MNKEEILNMPAGCEINKLIAENVLGMRLEKNYGLAGGFYWVGNGFQFGEMSESYLPDYSGDMNVAWSLIEKLENGQPEILCNISRISENGQRDGLEWHCHLRCIDGNSTYYYAIADTVPLAICRAALLARGLTKHAPDARESGAKIVKSKSKRSVKPARG